MRVMRSSCSCSSWWVALSSCFIEARMDLRAAKTAPRVRREPPTEAPTRAATPTLLPLEEEEEEGPELISLGTARGGCLNKRINAHFGSEVTASEVDHCCLLVVCFVVAEELLCFGVEAVEICALLEHRSWIIGVISGAVVGKNHVGKAVCIVGISGVCIYIGLSAINSVC